MRKPELESLLEDPGRFITAVEVEPGRGLQTPKSAVEATRRALEFAALDCVDLICATDNAGGHPQLRPEALARQVADTGQEVSITVSCKDVNRNGLESRLWEAANAGYRNLIAVSGDYPAAGATGGPKPVFDLDSVGLLDMVRKMNDEAGTRFFPGAVVNPFKWTEGEAVPQYHKLALKVRNGARFVITQIGFDTRKADELLCYSRLNGINVPFMGSVFLLSLPAAKAFRRGAIPGVTISDELFERAEREGASADRGRAFFLELAARQVALLRGLGYRGTYLSGVNSVDRLTGILEKATSYNTGDRAAFASDFPRRRRGFYYFELDPATGLNSDQASPRNRRSKAVPFSYRLGRLAHRRVFDPQSRGFKTGRTLYSKLETSDGSILRGLHGVEFAAKALLYGCRDCGDCSLYETALLCPESQCAKNQRNGPCGGSRNGRCEISDRHCIWVRAYYRFKSYGEDARMLDRAPVIKDGRLQGTSAWANTFMGRDHYHAVPADESTRPSARPGAELSASTATGKT